MSTANKIIAALCVFLGASSLAAGWMLLMEGDRSGVAIGQEIRGTVIFLGGYMLWLTTYNLDKIQEEKNKLVSTQEENTLNKE